MDDNLMDGIQMTGIVNALKTGNLVTDMVIAMSIPMVLRFLFGLLGKINFTFLIEFWNWLTQRKIPETQYYERRILHRMEKDGQSGSFANVDTDSNNHVLIKAIMMYLHHLQCLKLKTADLELTSMKADAGGSSSNNNNSYNYWSDSDSDSDDEDDDNALYNTLSKLKIIKNPEEDEWHMIGPYPSLSPDTTNQASNSSSAAEGEDPMNLAGTKKTDHKDSDEGKDGLFNVEFCLGKSEKDETEEEEEEGGKKKTQRIQKKKTTLDFRSLGEHSIDGFIQAAYDWYLNEIKVLGQDNSRFYYEMKDDDSESHTYKRYRLSDEKTFDSLFFREKPTITKLFGHFMNGTGRYGIKGYPQKLGLLLYGPPGTGKTSLIKAVAQYTKRHIVNVPLARIKTNAELNSIFFGNSFNVEGEYYSVKMGFKDIVFVMEDVDAASSIVKRRDGKKTADVTRTEKVELPVPRSMWRLLLESQEEECKELTALLIEKSKRLKEEAQSKDTLNSFAQRMTSLPGLTLAGHEGDIGSSSTVRKIATEALENAGKMMESSKSLDEYLVFHAKMIKALLEKGAEVGEEFESELLGESPPSSSGGGAGGDDDLPPPPITPSFSRDVSYTKTNGEKEFHEMENPKMMPPMPYAISPNNFITTTPGGGFASGMKELSQDPFGGGYSVYAQGGGGMGGGGGGGMGKDDGKDTKGGYGGYGGGGKYGKGAFGGGGYGGGYDLGGWGRPVRDELNLSGLLNVLDGVVDTPGRILIMTTNHPEILDPALIRPGRIDKKLILGYMEPDDVVQMLQHYFQVKLDETMVNRVARAVLGTNDGCAALSLTPAQVEQITAEHDDIADMVTALEKKGQQDPLPEKPSKADATKKGGGKRQSVMTFGN